VARPRTAAGAPVHRGCGSPGHDRIPLGKTLFQGVRAYAEQHNIEIEGLPKDPNDDVPPEQLLNVFRNFLATIFPLLAPAAPGSGPQSSTGTA
jgi:hypothetical protein